MNRSTGAVLERHGLRTALLTAVLCLGCQSRPPQPTRLSVKIILAHRRDAVVDPRVRPWLQGFGDLPFTGYALRDEATFTLALGTTGHLQLPDHSWLTVLPLESMARRVRAHIELAGVPLQTTVLMGQGATLAVGGVPYEDGRLLVTVTLLRA